MRPLALTGLVLVLLLSGAGTARAVEYTVDFETGPPLGQPITDEYVGTAFVRWIRDDPGYRPARRLLSRSETAADIGAARCVPEGGQGNECEFPLGGTTMQLTNTASRVALRAGLFTGTGGRPVTVRLRAYRAGSAVPVASSPAVQVGTPVLGRFATTLAVEDGAGLIQRVGVELAGDGARGAEVGIDDLVVDVPPGRSPDVGLSVPQDTQVVRQGATLEVPVTVTRVNGSSGDLAGSVAGLPPGTTGVLVPDPLGGTAESATLRITAAPDAPPDFVGQTATLTLTPASAAVAPAPRSIDLRVSVRAPFELSAPPGPHAIGQCASVDVPVTVARDGTFAATETATLSVSGVPANLDAAFVEGAAIGPGGGFTAVRTLRLTRRDDRPVGGAPIVVTATAPGAPARSTAVFVSEAAPSAELDAVAARGSVPSRLREGGRLRLTGNGFCPGTRVRIGNALGVADAALESPTAMAVPIPRLATTGAVTVLPPTRTPYLAAGAARIDSPRNFNGFQFDNPGWGNLSLDELRDLVGDDELFIQANPCWPIYDCSVPTPVPDPFAFAVWQGIEAAARSTGGHCFGITRFALELQARRIRASDFGAGATSTFSLPGPSGPDGRLGSYLDERHASQFTSEFIRAWLTRSKSLPTQLNRMRAELEADRLVGVIVKPGLFKGHVMLVHDIETRPDGETWLHLYDNEHPYLPEEESDTTGAKHEAEEQASRVVITPDKRSWTYGSWSGNGDFFTALTLDALPADATLPALATLSQAAIFGSTGGAAVSGPPSRGVEVLPGLDPNMVPGAAGTLIAPRGVGTVAHEMRGRRDGSWSQTTLSGSEVTVASASTARGVRDRVVTGEGSVRVAGNRDRALTLKVGSRGGATSRLATLRTRASAGGGDAVRLDGGAVVYDHDGDPARVRLRLEGVTRGKGVAALETVVPVRGGDRVTVRPSSWATLGRVRVTVRSARGRTRVRTVRSRGGGLAVRLGVGGLAVRRSGGSGRVARVVLRVGRLPQRTAAGVVVALRRGGRVVARRGVAVPGLRRGRRVVDVPLPGRLRPGRYALRATAIASAVGERTGTRRVSRSARVRVR